jgi:L,D-transpeptidase catalytic domain
VAFADTSPPSAASPPYEASVQATLPPVPTAVIDAEFMQLRRALIRQVPRAVSSLPPDRMRNLLARTRAALGADQTPVESPGLLVVVDRNPAVQLLVIVLARPDRTWQLVGGSHVSTGQAGRHGYFITPTGVFRHTDSILDYRAEGTFNENHIRGLGRKGMRVWDFGWVTAVKGWRSDQETGEMRLLLHATDPDFLERRLGHAASQGCIRISAAMNRFLDKYGVLDADYERAAAVDPSYDAVLRPDRTPTSLASRILVVIDSSMPMS